MGCSVRAAHRSQHGLTQDTPGKWCDIVFYCDLKVSASLYTVTCITSCIRPKTIFSGGGGGLCRSVVSNLVTYYSIVSHSKAYKLFILFWVILTAVSKTDCDEDSKRSHHPSIFPTPAEILITVVKPYSAIGSCYFLLSLVIGWCSTLQNFSHKRVHFSLGQEL